MSTDRVSQLPFIELEGNPYDIGVRLGRQGAEASHRHLIHTHAWATVTARRDSGRVRAAKALVERLYPQYFEEIRGLADGLEIPFADVFAWNCRGDVWAMSPDGCTTVQLPGAEPVIAHNEDGDPGLRSGCAIAKIRQASGNSFVAFVYPASLPGHTFAVNRAGLVLTVNNIRSRMSGDGLPRMVLARAVLDCTTLEEALGLVSSAPRAGAFHFTLGQAGEPDIYSLEFTHHGCSVLPVGAPRTHANHLIHPGIADERQVVTASSNSRQERCEELLSLAKGPIDPMTVLRDRARSALPIYRLQPDDPDCENTLATATFRIKADCVECAIYDSAEGPARVEFVRNRAMSG